MTKLLIGTVINIPAASAETVAASVAVVGPAFLSNPPTPATAARRRYAVASLLAGAVSRARGDREFANTAPMTP